MKYLPILLFCYFLTTPVHSDTQINSLNPKVEVWGTHVSQSEFKDSSEGRFDYNTFGIKISNLLFNFQYANSDLNWENVDQLPFGNGKDDPVDKVNRFRLSGKYGIKLNEQMKWINSLGFNLAYETSTNDALSINYMTFIAHQLNQDYQVIYGGFMNYHPVRTRIFPIAGLNYRFKEPIGFVGLLGFPKSYIGYGFNPTWQLSGGVIFDQFLFKLKENSSLEADGYAEVESLQGDVSLRYAHNSRLTVTSSLRWSSEYRFIPYDSDGSKVKSYKLNPIYGLRLGIAYQF